MRTRTRNLEPIYQYSYRRNTVNGPIVSQPYAPVYCGFCIADSITDLDKSERFEKPCLHTWTRQMPGYGQYHQINPTFGSGWFNQPSYKMISTLGRVTGTWDSTGLTLATVPLAVRQNALISMLPKVNDGLSLINFILELKDIRRMFDVKTLNKLLPSYGLPTYKKKRKTSLKEEVKDLSDDYLNYSFGWKPFVGDLIALYKVLFDLDKRLDYLKHHANRVLRRNVSIDLTNYVAPSVVTGWRDCDLGFWANWARHSYFSYSPRYHATLIYQYTFPKGVSAFRSKIRGYLDAFGIRPDLSVLWNAIPFSFVVDWFVDVGGFLRSFTPTDLGLEVSVLDFSQSVKYVQSTQTDYTVHWGFGGPQKGTTEIAGNVDKGYYERNNDIPSLHAISVTGLNMIRASLGGALVVSNQKGKRSHRRPSRM